MLDKGRASMASAYKSRLLSEAPKRNIIIGSPKNTYEFLKTCRVRAFQMELEFESVGFVEGENWSTRRIISRSTGEN